MKKGHLVRFLFLKIIFLNLSDRKQRKEVFNVSDPIGLKFLTRLRLNFSHLNEHKFNHNFNDTINPLCSCSLDPESTTHYLLHCLLFSTQRKILLDSLHNIDETISNLTEINLVTLLLYGNSKLYSSDINTLILNSTILYIKSSERFDIALF